MDEQGKIAKLSAVAEREDRLAEIREYALNAKLPKPGRFASYDTLVASDLAWLLQFYDEAIELLKIGVEDGWDHYQLDEAKALVRGRRAEPTETGVDRG